MSDNYSSLKSSIPWMSGSLGKGTGRERHRAFFLQHEGLWCAPFWVLCSGLISTSRQDRVDLEREQRGANKMGKDGKLLLQKMRLLGFLERRLRGRGWLNFGKSQRQKLRRIKSSSHSQRSGSSAWNQRQQSDITSPAEGDQANSWTKFKVDPSRNEQQYSPNAFIQGLWDGHRQWPSFCALPNILCSVSVVTGGCAPSAAGAWHSGTLLVSYAKLYNYWNACK